MSAINMWNIKDWNIEEETGYVPKTTFYMDFGIAEAFGMKAVKDTYEQAFREWKDDVEFITELVMVLNWKIWEHYKTNEKLARLYNDLWMELSNWCINNLKGADLSYYYMTTD